MHFKFLTSSVGTCYIYPNVCSVAGRKEFVLRQWLIAQLVERSLSVMKDPGSNLGEDICWFRY
jgi:hypothetical protein